MVTNSAVDRSRVQGGTLVLLANKTELQPFFDALGFVSRSRQLSKSQGWVALAKLDKGRVNPHTST
jgi:hypothetical protein